MLKAVYIGFGLLAAAVAGALLAPHGRVWGLHFLAYYPFPVQIAFALLAAAALWIGFTRVPWRTVEWRLPQAFTLRPLEWDILTALACGVLFLVLRSATALLGDGQLWLNEIEAGTSDYLKNRAPFTLFLLHTLYGWLNPLMGISAARLFGLVSVIAGVIAVLGWLTLGRHLHTGRFTALLFGFAWGGIAIFCGYIETYVLMTAVLTWMLVLAVISLRSGEPSLAVPVLGLLAIGFNLAAVAFLPAAAAYTWWMFSGRSLKPQGVIVFSLGALTVSLIAYFAFGWYKGTDVLLPLVSTSTAFGDAVFSARHAADLLNALILAAGAFVVLLAAYAIAKKETGFGWNTEKLVLVLAVIFPLAALIVHNPQLGMARDWDIAAVLLLSAPIISLVIWDSVRPFITSPARVQAMLAAWIFLTILPWAGVQASEARSLQRFKDLLSLDPEKGESGWDYLSSYYFHRNRIEEWAQCNFEAMKYSGNPRYHSNAALYYGMKRDWPNAHYQAGLARGSVMRDSALTAWEAEVTDPGALISLGSSYLDRTFIGDARQAYAVAAILQPESPWPEIAIADMNLRLRDFGQARKAIETLAGRGAKPIAQAQSYFAANTARPSADQQAAGWMGLSLIASAQGNATRADSTARVAYTLSRDEHIAQLLAALHQQAAQPTP